MKRRNKREERRAIEAEKNTVFGPGTFAPIPGPVVTNTNENPGNGVYYTHSRSYYLYGGKPRRA